MCHLCQKIDNLGRIDSKVALPIFILLSKLHKHVEPHLGDIWLWRHDETCKLRALLEKLHKFVPLSALQALLDDVDGQLLHIERNLPDHSPQYSTGRYDALELPVAPSHSMSRRRLHGQGLRRTWTTRSDGNIEEAEEGRTKTRRTLNLTSRNSMPNNIPRLISLGSDIDPSEVRIHQSIRMVDKWLETCDAKIPPLNCAEGDTLSLGSEVPGIVEERLHAKGSNDHLYSNSILDTDSIIDAPLHKVDRCVVGYVDELATQKEGDSLTHDLENFRRHRKVEKLSKRGNISITSAVNKLEARRMHRSHYQMSGGRSPGVSPNSSLDSLEAVVGAKQRRVHFKRNAQDYAPVPRKKMETNLGVVGAGSHASYRSEDSEGSVMSRCGSPLNAGSIVNRSGAFVEDGWNEGDEGDYYSPLKSPITPISSLLSALNTLVAIRRPPSPLPQKGANEKLLTVKRCEPQALEDPFVEVEIVRRSHEDEAARQRSTSTRQDRRMSDIEADSTISEAIKRSRRRRRERATNSIPSLDRYRHEERIKAWIPQEL